MEKQPSAVSEDDYLEIGRYVVVFSTLMAEMRFVIEQQLLQDDPMVPRLALGELNPAQIANAFFAICEQRADLDDEEKGVSSRLKQEVLDTIKQRNDVAHGDWELNLGQGAQLLRTKPGRKKGAWLARVWSVGELDAYSEDMNTLMNHVVEFAWLCLGIHPLTRYRHMEVRVRDIFRYQKHRGVLKKGRYADEPWFDEG